jgi:hypothetical protein
MAGDDKKQNEELLAIQMETAKLQLEQQKMAFEDLKYRVENERNRRMVIQLQHKNAQDTLAQANRDIIASQSSCKHKKGGKNLAGILNGNSENYSIWKHTYPWGATQVICSRCGKQWNKPALALRAIAPAQYKREMEVYNTVINWPTDNEPSGSVLFTFERNAPEPERQQKSA